MHVMGSSLYAPSVVDAVLKATRTIKANGGTVSFDPNLRAEILNSPGMREALAVVLGETDLFLPSGEELFLFSPADSEKEAIANLLKGGVKAVVLKRGAAGASYFDANREISLPGFRVTGSRPPPALVTVSAPPSSPSGSTEPIPRRHSVMPMPPVPRPSPGLARWKARRRAPNSTH